MAIAIYDYLGYYNICHLGDEVVNPARTIPRAIMIAIVIVALLYLTMNLAIIGVVPWERAIDSTYVASEFMELLYGRTVAELFTWFILVTVIASVFAMTLGYSRIPYAAAKNGGFFPVFAVVHPRPPLPGRLAGHDRPSDCLLLLLLARRGDQRRGDRANHRAIHRPDCGTAHSADNAPRRTTSLPHVALSSPQPGCTRRMDFRLRHGGSEDLIYRAGRARLGLRRVRPLAGDDRSSYASPPSKARARRDAVDLASHARRQRISPPS